MPAREAPSVRCRFSRPSPSPTRTARRCVPHAQQLDRQRVVGGAEQPDRQRAGRGRGRDQSGRREVVVGAETEREHDQRHEHERPDHRARAGSALARRVQTGLQEHEPGDRRQERQPRLRAFPEQPPEDLRAAVDELAQRERHVEAQREAKQIQQREHADRDGAAHRRPAPATLQEERPSGADVLRRRRGCRRRPLDPAQNRFGAHGAIECSGRPRDPVSRTAAATASAQCSSEWSRTTRRRSSAPVAARDSWRSCEVEQAVGERGRIPRWEAQLDRQLVEKLVQRRIARDHGHCAGSGLVDDLVEGLRRRRQLALTSASADPSSAGISSRGTARRSARVPRAAARRGSRRRSSARCARSSGVSSGPRISSVASSPPSTASRKASSSVSWPFQRAIRPSASSRSGPS